MCKQVDLKKPSEKSAVESETEIVTKSSTTLPKDAENAFEAFNEIDLAENVEMAKATTASVTQSVAEAVIQSSVQETEEVFPKDTETAPPRAVKNVSSKKLKC